MKELFISTHLVLFNDIIPPPAKEQVSEFKKLYMEKHNKDMDCQILSEAEVGGMNIFLTFDKKFYKKLKDKTNSINIMFPTKFLRTLNIQKGTNPKLIPAKNNPLFNKVNLWKI